LEAVLEKTVQADIDLGDLLNSVKTISQDDWAALSGIEQRHLFSRHTIHVVGEQKDKILRHIQNWEDMAGFKASFDLRRPLHVHGKYLFSILNFKF
jgi:hypothetical protein